MIARLRQRYTVAHEPLRSERRVELAVVGLAGLVLVQLLFLLGRYLASSEIRPLPPAPDSLAVVPRVQLETLSPQQSMEVLARPVFFASRRPLEPLPDIAEVEDAAQDGKKAGSLQGLAVLGIVENGTASRVIVSFKGEQQRLAIGESIQGWRLAEVAPGRAVLESGAERDERTLSPMPVLAAVPAQDLPGDDGAFPAAGTATPEAQRAAMQRQQKLEQPGARAVDSLSAGAPSTNVQPEQGTQ